MLELPLALVYLFLVLAVSVVTDIRHRKIRNWVVLAGLLGTGLILYYESHWYGLQQGLLGLLLAFAVTLPLVYLRVFGAGDSKLLLVVGLAVGPRDFLTILLLALLLSGVIALLGSLLTGRIQKFGANLSFGLLSMLSLDWRSAGDVASHTAYRVPFALPVSLAVGAWLYWFY